MANKTATKVELTNSTGFPRRYTVASGTTIAKNTVLVLSDPRTASENTTDTAAGLFCAGIAAMEKDGTDFSTSITAWTDGIFEVSASGVIAVGAPIKYVGSGYFMQIPTADLLVTASAGLVCGYSLETASDAEVINIKLRV